jgi:NAD(P)-dependent dehydrogenase (short-subunit alcohol dehydrogenase family)
MADLLTGKIAVISGAAHPRGIGRAIVEAMSANGATAIGTDLAGAEGLDDIRGLACDVTDAEQCESTTLSSGMAASTSWSITPAWAWARQISWNLPSGTGKSAWR